MRIALDASPLIATHTGVATYVSRLRDALDGVGPDLEVVPYTVSTRARLTGRVIGRWVPVPARWAGRRRGRMRRRLTDRALGPVDVVHGTNFMVPATSAPALVTVHDLSYVHEPDTVPPSVRRYDTTVRAAVDSGAWVHAPSEFVAAEVRARYGAQKVAVVGHAAPAPPQGTDERGAVPAVLSLATTTPRKQIPLLVDAFALVAYRVADSQLWLAGPAGPDEDEVDRRIRDLPLRVRARVRRLGLVSERERDRLLRRATVLAYPSRYEGFGLPVLEAMAAGLPVVAAASSSLPEAAGDAAVLVPTGSAEALASSLVDVLESAERREELAERGRQRAASLTWEGVARQMVDVYRTVAAERAS